MHEPSCARTDELWEGIQTLHACGGAITEALELAPGVILLNHDRHGRGVYYDRECGRLEDTEVESVGWPSLGIRVSKLTPDAGVDSADIAHAVRVRTIMTCPHSMMWSWLTPPRSLQVLAEH